MVERRRLPQDIQGLGGLQYLQHGTHAKVVGEAAINEMDVWPMYAILERL